MISSLGPLDPKNPNQSNPNTVFLYIFYPTLDIVDRMGILVFMIEMWPADVMAGGVEYYSLRPVKCLKAKEHGVIVYYAQGIPFSAGDYICVGEGVEVLKPDEFESRYANMKPRHRHG